MFTNEASTRLRYPCMIRNTSMLVHLVRRSTRDAWWPTCKYSPKKAFKRSITTSKLNIPGVIIVSQEIHAYGQYYIKHVDSISGRKRNTFIELWKQLAPIRPPEDESVLFSVTRCLGIACIKSKAYFLSQWAIPRIGQDLALNPLSGSSPQLSTVPFGMALAIAEWFEDAVPSYHTDSLDDGCANVVSWTRRVKRARQTVSGDCLIKTRRATRRVTQTKWFPVTLPSLKDTETKKKPSAVHNAQVWQTLRLVRERDPSYVYEVLLVSLVCIMSIVTGRVSDSCRLPLWCLRFSE